MNSKTAFEQKIIADMLEELKRAREKFPENDVQFIALIEEVGEFAQSILHLKEKQDGTLSTQAELREKVYREGIQTLAMVMRLLCEGDRSTAYRGRYCSFAGCGQPHIGGPCVQCYE